MRDDESKMKKMEDNEETLNEFQKQNKPSAPSFDSTVEHFKKYPLPHVANATGSVISVDKLVEERGKIINTALENCKNKIFGHAAPPCWFSIVPNATGSAVSVPKSAEAAVPITKTTETAATAATAATC